jgi:hypothetical protein
VLYSAYLGGPSSDVGHKRPCIPFALTGRATCASAARDAGALNGCKCWRLSFCCALPSSHDVTLAALSGDQGILVGGNHGYYGDALWRVRPGTYDAIQSLTYSISLSMAGSTAVVPIGW